VTELSCTLLCFSTGMVCWYRSGDFLITQIQHRHSAHELSSMTSRVHVFGNQALAEGNFVGRLSVKDLPKISRTLKQQSQPTSTLGAPYYIFRNRCFCAKHVSYLVLQLRCLLVFFHSIFSRSVALKNG
jgi:hypothetical protein